MYSIMADPYPIRPTSADECAGSAGRTTTLSAALTWDPAPWCPQLF
jgi:hypothetical protein